MTWEPAEAITVLDEFDELVRKAASVPMTDQVRLDPRTIDPLLDRLRTAVSGQPGLSTSVEDLEALVHEAKEIPFTNEIRVEREGIYDLLDGMRAVYATAAGESASTTAMPSEAAAAFAEFDDFVQTARVVPLTVQVRLNRTKAYALVDRLRTELREPPADAASALDQLDKLLHGAKSIPLTNEIRVNLGAIDELLDRIRTSG